jgi:hypothetical protein
MKAKRLEPNLLRYAVFQILLLWFCGTHANQQTVHDLFQNKFFTLSQNSELLCATSSENYLSNAELNAVVSYYEQNRPGFRHDAVQLLTNHISPEHQAFLEEAKTSCLQAESVDLCVLQKYWQNPEAALRVLALFYDTKTIIKHNDDYYFPRFTEDHIRSFEKSIRKIPVFMRASITNAKPIRKLKEFIKDLPPSKQELIIEAFPKDSETRVWLDDRHPLSLLPGEGFMGQVVAQVFNGRNSVVFTIDSFDKAKDGGIYRDIDLKYLVDFRLALIIHELAHVIDNFFFWDGAQDLYFFYRYRKISTDSRMREYVNTSKLALWPSKWFEAFEFLWEVNEGRYNGTVQEKFAELFAQYILIPERLKEVSPLGYAWIRDSIFQGIEYTGYSHCNQEITRSLTWWEDAIAKPLGYF